MCVAHGIYYRSTKPLQQQLRKSLNSEQQEEHRDSLVDSLRVWLMQVHERERLARGSNVAPCHHRHRQFRPLHPIRRSMKRIQTLFTCFLPPGFSRRRGGASAIYVDDGAVDSLQLSSEHPHQQNTHSSVATDDSHHGAYNACITPPPQSAPVVPIRRVIEAESPSGESPNDNPQALVRCESMRTFSRSPSISRSRAFRRLRSFVSRTRSSLLGGRRGKGNSNSNSSEVGNSGAVDVNSCRLLSTRAAENRNSQLSDDVEDSKCVLDDSASADSSDDSSFDEQSDAEDDDRAELCALDAHESQHPGQIRPRRRHQRQKRPNTTTSAEASNGSKRTADAAVDTTKSDSFAAVPSNFMDLCLDSERGGRIAPSGGVATGAASTSAPPRPHFPVPQPLRPYDSLSVHSGPEDSLLRLSSNISSSFATGSNSSQTGHPLQYNPQNPPPFPMQPRIDLSMYMPASAAQGKPQGSDPLQPYSTFNGRRGSGCSGRPGPVQLATVFRKMGPAPLHSGPPLPHQQHHYPPDASLVSTTSNATVASSSTSSPLTTPRSTSHPPTQLASFGSWLHPAGSVMSPSLILDTPEASARYSVNDSDLFRHNLAPGLSDSGMGLQTDSLALFMESAVIPHPSFNAVGSQFQVGAHSEFADTALHHDQPPASSTMHVAATETKNVDSIHSSEAPEASTSPPAAAATSRSRSKLEKLQALSFSPEVIPVVLKPSPPYLEDACTATKPLQHKSSSHNAVMLALGGGSPPNSVGANSSAPLSIDGISLKLSSQVGSGPDTAANSSPVIPLLSTMTVSGAISQNLPGASGRVATGADASCECSGALQNNPCNTCCCFVMVLLYHLNDCGVD